MSRHEKQVRKVSNLSGALLVALPEIAKHKMPLPIPIISEITAWDDRTLIWLNQFMFRWPLLDESIEWVLNATIIQFFPMIMAVCWLWFEKTVHQSSNRKILVESILTTLAALFFGRVFALTLPFRDRPFINSDLHFISPLEPDVRTWSSFPSDHAVMAFALAASLFRISPRVGLWAYFHATVFICLPRLYFGLHYPSDLIGGALIGILLVITMSRLRGRHVVTSYLLSIENRYPAILYTFGFFVLYEMSEMFLTFRVLANYLFLELRYFLT